MKIKTIILALVCAGFVFGGAIGVARAEQKIAVVDIQMLARDSSAAKSIGEQSQKRRAALQSEFEKYEKDILEQRNEIIEIQKSDDQKDLDKKRQEFEKTYTETQALYQKKLKALERAVLLARAKLIEEVVEIVSKIADEKGYDFVLTRQNVVFANGAFDISEDVKASLEKSLKKIDLKVEE